MNIAVIGRDKINTLLKDELEASGFRPCIIENPYQIKRVDGEVGKYTIATETDIINVHSIIVTEQPKPLRKLESNYPYIYLTELEDISGIGDNGTTVVFILDYPYESSTYTSYNALNKAFSLARKKKRVLYFSRFMRTSATELEDLYREARNAGVTFIKYSEIEVTYSEESDVFTVKANDGYESITVSSRTVIVPENTLRDDNINKIAKLLRIKLDEDGFINSDKYFLFPVLTSRKGVYSLNTNLAGDDGNLMSHIRFIVSDISNGANALCSDRSTSSVVDGRYAEIDSEKCAFCYTCYRACPHAAMVPDYENSVMKNMNFSCDACGICVSVCPADAVRISTREHLNKPGGGKSLKIYCCENSGEIAIKRLAEGFGKTFEKVEVESVFCGGELSVETIVSTLNSFERVLVITCVDEACRHFDGNKRARRFVERAKEMLKASGIDENRVEYIQVSHAMTGVVEDYIKDMI